MIVDLTLGNNITGYCDKLKLLTFYVTIAQIRHEKILYIKEEKTLGGPFLFIDICEIDGLKLLQWNKNVTDSGLIIDNCFEPTSKPSIKFVRLNKPKDLNITEQSFLLLWISAYQKIHPKTHIKQKIDSLNINNDCLGLHIRMTDKIVDKIHQAPASGTITSDQINRMNAILEKKISKLFRKNISRNIFLASDDQKWKEAWKIFLQKTGYHVITNNTRFNGSNFRQTSGEDFVIDLFSLAKCNYIIGTVYSGIPISAAYINGSSKYDFVFDRLIFYKWINHFLWQIHHQKHLNLHGLLHDIYINHFIKYRFVRNIVRDTKNYVTKTFMAKSK
jgi:hypothetical protein